MTQRQFLDRFPEELKSLGVEIHKELHTMVNKVLQEDSCGDNIERGILMSFFLAEWAARLTISSAFLMSEDPSDCNIKDVENYLEPKVAKLRDRLMKTMAEQGIKTSGAENEG